MANITLILTAVGLQEINERAVNKVVPDTWKLHSNSNAVTYSFATVIGDATESLNTTAQDLEPVNFTSVASDPTVTTTYGVTVSIPIAGGASTSQGYYVTNQAGTKLIAGGIAPTRTLADGDSFTVTGIEFVSQQGA